MLNVSENTMPLLQQGQATSPDQFTTRRMATHLCTSLCPACDMHHPSTSPYRTVAPGNTVRLERDFQDTPGYCYITSKLVYPFRRNEKCAIDVSAPDVWQRFGELRDDVHEMLYRLDRLEDAICQEQDQISCEQEAASCL